MSPQQLRVDFIGGEMVGKQLAIDRLEQERIAVAKHQSEIVAALVDSGVSQNETEDLQKEATSKMKKEILEQHRVLSKEMCRIQNLLDRESERGNISRQREEVDKYNLIIRQVQQLIMAGVEILGMSGADFDRVRNAVRDEMRENMLERFKECVLKDRIYSKLYEESSDNVMRNQYVISCALHSLKQRYAVTPEDLDIVRMSIEHSENDQTKAKAVAGEQRPFSGFLQRWPQLLRS